MFPFKKLSTNPFQRWRDNFHAENTQKLTDAERTVPELRPENGEDRNENLWQGRLSKNWFEIYLGPSLEGKMFCQVEIRHFYRVHCDSPYFAMVPDDSVEGDIIAVVQVSFYLSCFIASMIS